MLGNIECKGNMSTYNTILDPSTVVGWAELAVEREQATSILKADTTVSVEASGEGRSRRVKPEREMEMEEGTEEQMAKTWRQPLGAW